MAEAAAQLRKGLDQLALLPETPERQRQKLEFWTALGAALNAVKGAAAPETGRAYASARELWETARFALGILWRTLCAVALSLNARRIQAGDAVGRGFAASEP
jgi:hypothetical protein